MTMMNSCDICPLPAVFAVRFEFVGMPCTNHLCGLHTDKFIQEPYIFGKAVHNLSTLLLV